MTISIQPNYPLNKKYKSKINWDNKLEYAQRQLDQNKANIEDTPKGTKGFKASTWSRKSKQNRSKVF